MICCIFLLKLIHIDYLYLVGLGRSKSETLFTFNIYSTITGWGIDVGK